MKKSLINNFTNSFFCKDYKKLLEGKKLVFVNDDDGIPIQNWGMRSEKYDHVKVNDIDTVKTDKFVFGID